MKWIIAAFCLVFAACVWMGRAGYKQECPVPSKPKPLPDLADDLDSVDHVLWRMYHTIDTTAYLQLPRLRQKVHDDSVIYKFERVIK